MISTRVSLSDPIWAYVSSIIELTYPEMCICWIDKINNSKLYEEYQKRKDIIKHKRGFVDELTLFHGTRDSAVTSIIKHGFMSDLNVTSAYGIGTYFSTSSKISSFYSKNSSTELSYMFVCKVLVGKTKIGLQNETINIKEFDNTINTKEKPTIYTTPYDDGAYPEYLVAFYKNN